MHWPSLIVHSLVVLITFRLDEIHVCPLFDKIFAYFRLYVVKRILIRSVICAFHLEIASRAYIQQTSSIKIAIRNTRFP